MVVMRHSLILRIQKFVLELLIVEFCSSEVISVFCGYGVVRSSISKICP